MKVLAALSVLQIAAIVFLASKIVALDRAVDQAAAAAPAEALAEPVRTPSEPVAAKEPDPFPDERTLRRIVREELAAQLGALSWPEQVAAAAAGPVDPVAEADRQHQLEWVTGEIDRYVGRGTISDLEMSDLQMDIAKLDEEERKRMLGRLVRAINAGELKGRF